MFTRRLIFILSLLCLIFILALFVFTKQEAIVKVVPIANPTGQTLIDKLTKVALPEQIVRVDRLVYVKRYAKLFLVAAETDNTLAVWSLADGQFKRLLAIAGSDYHLSTAILNLDSLDNVYFEVNEPHHFYRSADGGLTWQLLSRGDKDVFWSIADAGNGLLYGTAWSANSPVLYRSLDQGLTWRAWQNFHKLFPREVKNIRHLHDVAVYQGKILVGTGDNSRWSLLSTDQGQTWQKIWNEGFTAHLFVGDTGKIILGGDCASRYALASYDFNVATSAVDIWDQSKLKWSSYIYSMLFKNGRYYAAVHNENADGLNYGILSSADGINWSPWLTYQSPAASITDIYLADSPADYFYISKDGALYLSK